MTNTEVIVHSVYSLSLFLFLSQLAVLHYVLAFFLSQNQYRQCLPLNKQLKLDARHSKLLYNVLFLFYFQLITNKILMITNKTC